MTPLLLCSRLCAWPLLQTQLGLPVAVRSLSSPAKSAAVASHVDLESFKAYAAATGLSQETTVYRGTLYEYTVQTVLRRLNFLLRRCGGADDRGIDLRGSWYLQNDADPLRVIVQCKSLNRKIGPNLVREMEGAIANESNGTLGVFASNQPYTDATNRQLLSSQRPMILCVISTLDEGADLKQMVWNTSASDMLGKLEVGVRHRTSNREVETEIFLKREGKPIKELKKLP
ncbi:hypothetical protein SAICODRAFT_90186 [Saitoella complicata NRRL Y-17804]|uniref:Restriction endonuclease type IV Mrr domain-containing protein n=1 Tax=Saitoella complicata (strain BCRC 22490 / CBS 7301 / JCM 7358 / NBRC 10748 / NRRL Y-17804) TaxID=698492 RepID=A0A0E9N7P1_SAICN|nr:uncharacterized protein SAICODRAFT_90186 [Saitoella complicata NRRL Y-17804]ODQ54466.1 hypothetical protein SAICODRAFT_90186 [Saitoella complicata NRRL Y-17804]GAO45922.1 hypothetical protein G7K_0168-t1 [Saitoella complicata NRRL Y-17804]